ncbi:hypothetical protein [Acholeplasma hippikon]|uniref:Nudix hydrolase domain-containing protein n=1 Tax=Acholeplasma hippikon TaxID=264636 RepID=A0A449BHT3_9MOLU|nr:hypothetical protein [Acholeplasma hippikon]VEU82021.1 Uncharacterised protein [Acholeplasma hippikon]
MEKLIGRLTDKNFNKEEYILLQPDVRFIIKGIIFNAEGKIALINRVHENEYKLPGVELLDTETKDFALKRCAKDMLCHELEVYNQIGIFEEVRSKVNLRQISYVFLGVVKHEKTHPFISETFIEDNCRVIWVTLDEAIKLIEVYKRTKKEFDPNEIYHHQYAYERELQILNYYKETI